MILVSVKCKEDPSVRGMAFAHKVALFAVEKINEALKDDD